MERIKSKLQFEKNRRNVKHCPCGKSNRNGKFVPYRGFENKGYCFSCGKSFLPNQGTIVAPSKMKSTQEYRISYHDHDLQDRLIKMYNEQPQDCNLTNFLLSKFTFSEVQKATQDYYVTGTDHFWKNSTMFWQIDEVERIHAAKIMLYDPSTGKRIKSPYAHINWLHNTLEGEFNLNQCLFGLHLVNESPEKTIGIVEGEKTAIMMSIFLPEMIWLATGSKHNLKPKLLKSLENRRIILYPDKGEYDAWETKANELRIVGLKVVVSETVERIECVKGFDLADLYLKIRN